MVVTAMAGGTSQQSTKSSSEYMVGVATATETATGKETAMVTGRTKTPTPMMAHRCQQQG
jgi:hypothetical protein